MNNINAIKTKRLIVKPISVDRVNAFYEKEKNPETADSFSKMFLREKREVLNFLANNSKSCVFYGIFLKENESLIGLIDISPPEKRSFDNLELEDGSLEFSCLITKKFWGLGIMQEASLALFENYFEKLNCPAIYAIANTKNKKSLILLNKLGFEEIEIRKDIRRKLDNKKASYIQEKITLDDWMSTKKLNEQYEILDHKSVDANIIKELIDLDKAVYDQGYYSNKKTYLEFNKKCPLMYHYIKYKKEDKVIGYLSMYPIKNNVYKALISGKCKDTVINKDDLENPTEEGFYSLYFASIVIHPDHQNTGLVYDLIKAKILAFAKLAKKGIYFNRIIADVISDDGEKIVKQFNLKCYKKSNHNSKIFRWLGAKNKERCYDNLYNVIDKIKFKRIVKDNVKFNKL